VRPVKVVSAGAVKLGKTNPVVAGDVACDVLLTLARTVSVTVVTVDPKVTALALTRTFWIIPVKFVVIVPTGTAKTIWLPETEEA
jgi:hypothetical protein